MSHDKTSNLKQTGFLRKNPGFAPFPSRLTIGQLFDGTGDQTREIDTAIDQIRIPPTTTQARFKCTEDASALKSMRDVLETDNPVYGIGLGLLVGAFLWLGGIIALLRIL